MADENLGNSSVLAGLAGRRYKFIYSHGVWNLSELYNLQAAERKLH